MTDSKQAKPRYHVATAGLDSRDVRLIEIVFRHSQYNAVDYRLVPPDAVRPADVLIINPFEPTGLRTLSKVRASGMSTPMITAVPAGMSSPARHAIHIQKLTLQLLPVLNELVKSEFGLPEPQAFRVTANTGKPVSRETLDSRVDQSEASVVRRKSSKALAKSDRQQTADNDEGSTLMPASDLVPSTIVSTLSPDSTFAGSTVITTLSADTGFGATVRAIPVPPASILTSSIDVFPTTNTRAKGARFGVTKDKDRATAGGSRTVQILVVDDSPTVRRQMSQALQRMGLKCVAVPSAKDALARIEQEHFEMALVDVVMADMDGYQLTKAMRRRFPDMPVVILTSRSSPFDLARGALAGCSSFLVKPVPLKKLHAIVLKQLRKSLAIDDLPGLLKADSDASVRAAAVASRSR
jgi:CheY-like chemotaxis protein